MEMTLENLFGTDTTKSQTTIYQHQYDCIRYLQFIESKLNDQSAIKGAILADEQGLGKTREIIGLCEVIKVPLTLIVTIKATTFAWYREALNTAIGCRVYGIIKGKYNLLSINSDGNITFSPRESEFVPGYGNHPTIVILNYESFTPSNTEMLNKVSWARCITDESHTLKNGENTKTFNILSAINHPVDISGNRIGSRFAVTGTPIQNDITDLISIFQWIDNRTFLNSSNRSQELEYAIKGHLFRRNKNQITPYLKKLMKFPTKEPIFYQQRFSFPETELSRKIQTLSYGELQQFARSPEIRKNICNDERAFYITIATDIKFKRSTGNSSTRHLTEDTNLRNVLSCPYDHPVPTILGNEIFTGSSSKIKQVIEIIRSRPGESFIIFHRFRPIEIRTVKELNKVFPGISVSSINGDINSDIERDQILTKNKKIIENGHQSILFLSTQTAAEGLNCQFYCNMILLDLEWNPKLESQALSRIYRIGQDKQVSVWHLITSSFYIHNELIEVDDKIEAVKLQKEPLSDVIEQYNTAWFFKRLYLPDDSGRLVAGSYFGNTFESRPHGSLGGPDSIGSPLLDTYPH